MHNLRKTITAGALATAVLATACGGSGTSATGNEAAATDAAAPDATTSESGADDAEPVADTAVIGSNNPMSGAYAEFGSFFQQGAELAVKHIAEDDLGVDLELRFEDSQNEPQQAVTNLRSLAERNDVRVVTVGGSAPLLAQAPLAEQLDVFLVNVAGLTPEQRGITDYLYSLIHDAQAEAAFGVEAAVERWGTESIGVIYPDNAQGAGTAKGVESAAAELGLNFGGGEAHPEDLQDARPQLLNLQRAGVDTVYVGTPGEDAGVVLRQAAEIGLDAHFMGMTHSATMPALEAAGDAGEGFVSTTLAFDPEANEQAQRFASDYEDAYGAEPTSYAAIQYDAVRMIAEAIAANGYGAADIKSWFEQVDSYTGVSGDISFDDENVRRPELQLVEFRDGAIEPVT